MILDVNNFQTKTLICDVEPQALSTSFANKLVLVKLMAYFDK